MWHDSEDRLSKAVERFEEGAVEAARIMLRNLDRRGVISPRIDLYLGHCHLEAGAHRAAIRRYRRCVALSPDSPAPWLGLGLCYGRLGHIERAIDAFRAALTRSPEMEEVHCNLVHCYALSGDLQRAEEHARQAIVLDPTCPHVHRHLALAYLLAGQSERSLAAWRRVRVLKPDHPELRVGMGRALAQLQRRAESRRCFLDAMGGPFGADACYGLGDLARDDGDEAKAAEHYQRAFEADPAFGEARLRRAECLADLGRYDEAWEALGPLSGESEEQQGRGLMGDKLAGDSLARGSLAGDVMEGEALEGDVFEEVAPVLARVLHGRGFRRRALRLLRAHVDAEPESAQRWLALGRHLLDVGRGRVALPACQRAARLDPDDPDTSRALARALARTGQGSRAVSVLARAAHRIPSEQELHMDVAAALIARGRDAAAERALLRGLSWNPEAALLWAAAAELAFDSGRMPLARARLRSALRRDRRHPLALSLLVRWLVAVDRPAQAANAGRAAVRVLPADDPAVCAYGRALLASGRPHEALLQLRRYVLAAASDPQGYEVLAHAMDAIGDASGARTQRRLQELVTAP